MTRLPKDLHQLPKLRDSLSFLYIEHAVIEQDALSIVALREGERVPVPIAAMTVLLLGRVCASPTRRSRPSAITAAR